MPQRVAAKHHREQIDDRTVAQPGFHDKEIDADGDDRDHDQRQQNVAHFYADEVEIQGVEHGRDGLWPN